MLGDCDTPDTFSEDYLSSRGMKTAADREAGENELALLLRGSSRRDVADQTEKAEC